MTQSLASHSNASVGTLADAILEESTRLYGTPSGIDDPLYDDLRSYLTEMNRHDFRIEEIQATLPNVFTKTKRILDLGAGPGIFALRLLQAGYDVHGLDLDSKKIELAHAHIRENAFPAEWANRLVLADAGRMPFDDGAFDLVASYHVLEHVSDLRSVLYEAVRVTKRGGYLYLQAPDYRYSYDTHYCMPWPRMMPPAQARAWCLAMGRPVGGIETIYRITFPEVVAILESLDCRIAASVLREHQHGTVRVADGAIPADPIVFAPDVDPVEVADELKRLTDAGRLPKIYDTCLEFILVAQRR